MSQIRLTFTYYRMLLTRAAKETAEFLDIKRRGTWVTIVLSVIEFSVLWNIYGVGIIISDTLLWVLRFLIPVLTLFFVVFAVRVFVLPARTDQERSEQIAKLDIERKTFLDREKPKLEITFNDAMPYKQKSTRLDNAGQAFLETYIRVGIVNSGLTTIDGVTVELAEVDPNIIPYLPLPLHLMHDNPQPGQSHQLSFSLNPGETKYVDVMGIFEGATTIPYKDNFAIWHNASTVSNLIPIGHYTFRIRATGRNIVGTAKGFLVATDSSGRFDFKPLI